MSSSVVSSAVVSSASPSLLQELVHNPQHSVRAGSGTHSAGCADQLGDSGDDLSEDSDSLDDAFSDLVDESSNADGGLSDESSDAADTSFDESDTSFDSSLHFSESSLEETPVNSAADVSLHFTEFNMELLEVFRFLLGGLWDEDLDDSPDLLEWSWESPDNGITSSGLEVSDGVSGPVDLPGDGWAHKLDEGDHGE